MPKTATKKATASKSSKKQQGETEPMLKEFFYDSLKDIYWAEKHLLKALPKLNKAATSDTLKTALTEHLEETKIQVERLEQVFELLGEKAQAKKCDAMEGLSKEADSVVEDTEDGSATRDVAIILACQKVEHYEIATYGGLAQLAKTLQLEDIAGILEETLVEEKAADEKLTDIAENDINFQAADETEEEA
ncbi:MAG TPA: ferritin-like domain-containing protein [Ferruginibacter sp.]|nr:ferritin-like domain-containing protein [Ferruginibacter sp.]HPH90537.1 ferritin-like domain-containing protein [Ferruginibacter sp.]